MRFYVDERLRDKLLKLLSEKDKISFEEFRKHCSSDDEFFAIRDWMHNNDYATAYNHQQRFERTSKGNMFFKRNSFFGQRLTRDMLSAIMILAAVGAFIYSILSYREAKQSNYLQKETIESKRSCK